LFYPQNDVSRTFCRKSYQLHDLHIVAWNSLPGSTVAIRRHIVPRPRYEPKNVGPHHGRHRFAGHVRVRAPRTMARLALVPMLKQPAVMPTQYTHPARFAARRTYTIRTLCLRREPEHTSTYPRLDPCAYLDTLYLGHVVWFAGSYGLPWPKVHAIQPHGGQRLTWPDHGQSWAHSFQSRPTPFPCLTP